MIIRSFYVARALTNYVGFAYLAYMGKPPLHLIAYKHEILSGIMNVRYLELRGPVITG